MSAAIAGAAASAIALKERSNSCGGCNISIYRTNSCCTPGGLDKASVPQQVLGLQSLQAGSQQDLIILAFGICPARRSSVLPPHLLFCFLSISVVAIGMPCLRANFQWPSSLTVGYSQ